MTADPFRINSTPLTEDQNLAIINTKKLSMKLFNEIEDMSERMEQAELDKRSLAIAKTHLETAVMFAVKGFSAPKK